MFACTGNPADSFGRENGTRQGLLRIGESMMTSYVSQGSKIIEAFKRGIFTPKGNVCGFCSQDTDDHDYWCPYAIEERSMKRININPSEKEISKNFSNNRCIKCSELMTIGHTHSTIELDIEQTKEKE
jgi:hypothetical protein